MGNNNDNSEQINVIWQYLITFTQRLVLLMEKLSHFSNIFNEMVDDLLIVV